MNRRMLFTFQFKKQLGITMLFAVLAALFSAGAVLLYEERHILSLSDVRAQSPALFAALGVGGSASLLQHLGALLYGFLLPLMGTLLAAVLAARLMAAQVQTGEMAYWLALPQRRITHVLTQWTVQLACLAVFTVLPALVAAVVALALKPGELQVLWFALLNLGLFLLCATAGGLAMMISCGQDEGRRARRLALLACGLFLLVGLAGRMRGAPAFVRYLSYYTLFDVPALSAGRVEGTLIILPGLAALFTLAGAQWFSGRDLPL